MPAANLPNLPDPLAIQFWMGSNAHLLHYAIGGEGEDVNFFAVTEGPAIWPGGDKWVIDAEPGEAVAAFKGWHPAVQEMVAAGWVTKRWGLFVVQQPSRWHRGRAVLLGRCRACHAGRIMARAPTLRSRTRLPWLSWFREARWRTGMRRWPTINRCAERGPARSSGVRGATNTLLHLPDGPGNRSSKRANGPLPRRFRLDS